MANKTEKRKIMFTTQKITNFFSSVPECKKIKYKDTIIKSCSDNEKVSIYFSLLYSNT